MAAIPTCIASGAVSAAIGSLHTVFTTTTPGVYVVNISTANLTDGTTPDAVEFYVVGRVRPADSDETLYYSGQFTGQQNQTFKASIATVSPHYYLAQLRQLQGTGRTFNWSVYAL